MVVKLKSIKCSLKQILQTNVKYDKLFDCIRRTNQLTFYCYHFIRYYILKKFKSNEEIPEINVDFVRRAFKVLSIESRGPKNKQPFGDLKQKVDRFMEHLKLEKFFDASNLSYILNEEEVKIATVYSNNIKINFHKYLFQCLNELFEVPHIPRKSKEDYNKMSIDERKNYRNEVDKITTERREKLKNLYEIKKDLLTNTLNAEKRHHKFIQNFRKEYLPEINGNDLIEDVKKNPFKYLKSLLKMNRVLEEQGLKLFQPLPLRCDLSPKYISLNTGALKCIFGSKDNSKLQKHEIWKKYFNISLKKFKIKGHCFDNYIQTDGCAVSIIFMKNEDFVKKTEIHKKMCEASKKGKIKLKTTTLEEIKKSEKNKKKIQLKKDNQKKESINKKKEEFKKLSNDEKEEIKLKFKMNKEFVYFGDVLKCEIMKNHLNKQYTENKIIACDPGKRSILTMMDSRENIFNYRKRRRMKDTKRKKYQTLRQHKFNSLIEDNKKLNDELKNHTCKTTHVSIFVKYIKTKFSLIERLGNDRLKDFGNYINKLRWYSYINTRRHEDTILNEIEKKYGKNTTIVIGDWSQSDGIKGISAPSMGIKRLLKKRFEVYLIDEYNTSQIHHKTGEKMKHHKIMMSYQKDGKEIKYSKEMYSILTFKTSNGNGCINRDINAVKNMLRIIEGEINETGRPVNLQRIKKSVNPH